MPTKKPTEPTKDGAVAQKPPATQDPDTTPEKREAEAAGTGQPPTDGADAVKPKPKPKLPKALWVRTCGGVPLRYRAGYGFNRNWMPVDTASLSAQQYAFLQNDSRLELTETEPQQAQ